MRRLFSPGASDNTGLFSFQNTERLMKRLRFTKEGDKLVGKVLDEGNSYWIFSDITDNSFIWRNVMISEDGTCIPD